MWKISQQNPANSHSITTLCLQYLISSLLVYWGKHVYNNLIIYTCNVKQHQEKLLLSILHLNKDTEYGTQHHFSTIASREAFVRSHGLKTYDDYMPYIQRMEKGEDTSLLDFCLRKTDFDDIVIFFLCTILLYNFKWPLFCLLWLVCAYIYELLFPFDIQ